MIIQRRHSNIRQRFTYCLVALLLVTFTGMPLVYAEDATTEPAPAATTEQPAATESAPTTTGEQTTSSSATAEPQPATTSPQQPTGADTTSYTYNESTGLWENDKYTWNPTTKQTSPKTTPDYSYNPSTGMWDTTKWVYDAPSGTYVPNIISTALPPTGESGGTTNETVSPVGTSTQADNSGTSTDNGPTKTSQTSSADSARQASAATSSPSTTLPASSGSGVFDLFYNALISNNISSKAVTGDALVTMNTLAGNALSGDASSIATILNLLQSTWNLGLAGSLVTTFTQNLFGDLVGDLWLQPGETSGTTAAPTTPGDLTVNSSQDAAIDNTITLEAASGDATVASNTKAGNATTGSATVVANIINAINSSIVSGNSFLGVLNIFGNLNGDILLPQELISTLLASNAIGTLDTGPISNTDVLGEFTNTANTTNTVTAAATSGNADVTKNTSAGNATTGDATTNVTVLNLTGRQVVGKDALLVFVNVLGKWVGMIVNAPTGTTSAALGGGITQDLSLAVNANNNQTINNDINLLARSGDALVTKNTTAGNASSGDAYAAANILNMNTSQFSLSDWFGVLFINVFGSWNGSFGIDTPAGTLPPAALTAVQTGSAPLPTNIPQQAVRAFGFTPHDDGSYTLTSSDDGIAALAEANVLTPAGKSHRTSPKEVLASQTTNNGKPSSGSSLSKAVQSPRDWTLALLTSTLGLSLLGAERIASRRASR